MTKELLRLLSNCAAEFFEAHFEKILAKPTKVGDTPHRQPQHIVGKSVKHLPVSLARNSRQQYSGSSNSGNRLKHW